MKTQDYLLLGLGGYFLLNSLTKGVVGQTAGKAAGETITSGAADLVEGTAKGIWQGFSINPYEKARERAAAGDYSFDWSMLWNPAATAAGRITGTFQRLKEAF